MAEETSNDTGCVMNDAANCFPTDDATADELFDSFMEIANDPELQNEETDAENGTISEAVGASVPSVLQVIDSCADEQTDTASGTCDQGEINTSVPSVLQVIDSCADEQTDTASGTHDQGEINTSVPSVLQVKDSCADEQTDTASGTRDQGEINISDSSVSQLKDVNSSIDELQTDANSGTNDQSETAETDQRDSLDRTHDQGETTESSDPNMLQVKDVNSSVDEQTCSQASDDVEKVDSTESVPVSSQVNSDDNPVQSATEVPTESSEQLNADNPLQSAAEVSTESSEQLNSDNPLQSATDVPTESSEQLNADNPLQSATDVPIQSSEQVMPNPVCEESKPDELSPTSDTVQSCSDATNEADRTEELTGGTEGLDKSTGSSDVTAADGNESSSADPREHSVENAGVPSDDKGELSENRDLTSENNPSTSETDVAKRLSKAMEDLAGLEQQLSSAVTKLKRSNSKKEFIENGEGEELTVNTQEGQTLENDIEEPPTSQATVADTIETKGKEELVASQASEEFVVLKTDEECNVPSVCETGKQATVCDTDVTLNAGSVDSNNDETVVESTHKDSKDADNSKDAVDNVCDDSKEIDVDATEVREDKMENSVSDKQDIPTNEDIQVESNVLATCETADVREIARQEVDSTATDTTEELPKETIAEDSKNGKEASIEKSDSMDELDVEVAKACMSIPDIEITTDESGISERKSLDSLDTEGSSNSRPTSPTYTDDGIDSDTPSDYGDDDDDATFVPENVAATRRKSWLLETDRDRMSSDSSTVSEKDFKDSYNKGDNADGKSPKDDYIRGHLLKMGGSGLTPKNWRKRWFALRSDKCLYYYKQSKDKVPCGVIILSNYSISKAPEVNKNHCFKLTKGGARTYYMCAGSDTDMKKWMVAMMDAIKESSGSSHPFNILQGSVHNVSIPALSIRDPDCHGYLYKQGHNIKTWRRRYFVLKNGFLYYYSDMSNTVALGVAKLIDYTIQIGVHTGKKFCFNAISTDSSSRTYYFAAESEMDRTRWSTRLEDSIKKGSLIC